MSNLQGKNKQINTYKKGLIIICIFLIIEASVFLPVLYKKIQYNNLEINNIQSIEYVEYENELFSSVVLSHRYTQDTQIIDEFINASDNGKIKPYYRQKDAVSILIIKTENGKTLYVYVQSDIVGFDYGKVNIQIQNLDNLIMQIPQVDLVTMKN